MLFVSAAKKDIDRGKISTRGILSVQSVKAIRIQMELILG
jgi:hypothetical protein